MEFRPCIDIHNGKVKQIVGGTLRDAHDTAQENFVSEQDAAFYARFYQKDRIKGAHVILLNAADSPYYAATKAQALAALRAYPGGLQAGGGITPENAAEFLEAGASHVVVTSYVFKDGKVNYKNLERLVSAVGKDHLVLDLSCRKKPEGGGSAGDKNSTFAVPESARVSHRDEERHSGEISGEEIPYYIVTDRWQKFTREKISPALLDELSSYADEFLVHAVDVEGKASGIEEGLVRLLGSWGRIPVTYAGGVASFAHLRQLWEWGNDRLNVTVGSALDLFGGSMSYGEVLRFCRQAGEE